MAQYLWIPPKPQTLCVAVPCPKSFIVLCFSSFKFKLSPKLVINFTGPHSTFKSTSETPKLWNLDLLAALPPQPPVIVIPVPQQRLWTIQKLTTRGYREFRMGILPPNVLKSGWKQIRIELVGKARLLAHRDPLRIWNCQHQTDLEKRTSGFLWPYNSSYISLFVD